MADVSMSVRDGVSPEMLSGGLTVLKYTGPIPERAPIPGLR